jgi:hypothetical protein
MKVVTAISDDSNHNNNIKVIPIFIMTKYITI